MKPTRIDLDALQCFGHSQGHLKHAYLAGSGNKSSVCGQPISTMMFLPAWGSFLDLINRAPSEACETCRRQVTRWIESRK